MSSRTNARNVDDAANDAANEAADAARAGSEAAKNTAKAGADAARDTAKAGADAARDTAEAGVDAARDATRTGADAARDITRTGAEAAKEATARFGNIVADSQRNLSENFGRFSRGIEGMTSFQQDNVEAVVRSSEIAAKAFEGIGSEITAYSKRSLEEGVAAAQDFASAKTATELFEKQTAYAQNAFEDWLHQTTKMNEIIAAAAKDITAPLGQRVSAASDAMKSFSL